jgi:hypothetical protein
MYTEKGGVNGRCRLYHDGLNAVIRGGSIGRGREMTKKGYVMYSLRAEHVLSTTFSDDETATIANFCVRFGLKPSELIGEYIAIPATLTVKVPVKKEGDK